MTDIFGVQPLGPSPLAAGPALTHLTPSHPAGLLLDPYEGARSMSGWLAAVGAMLGVAKAILGLGMRPTAGVFETTSKVLQVGRGKGGWSQCALAMRHTASVGH